MLLFSILLVLQITGHLFHPQCLDFRAPFEPTNQLSFCGNYSRYSCCTSEKVAALRHDFEYILGNVKSLDATCTRFVQDLICLECHPYAAHAFDAERPDSFNVTFSKRAVHFPGLCKPTCLKLFQHCKAHLMKFVRYTNFLNFMRNASSTEFCDWAVVSDNAYCYPNIINREKKEQPVIESQETLTLCVEQLPDHFANPLAGVHSNDGTHRMFVAEQQGIIYVIQHGGRKLEIPFLNITDRVLNSGSPWDERGLLGLVFHPRYRNNGRFYVQYSFIDSNNKGYGHKTRISEFTVSSRDPNRAEDSSELVLLEINQPEPNHNGGMILFGRDGYLYVFPGDGGGVGDEHYEIGNGLNMSTLLGKVLRIDVNIQNRLYSVPSSNPFIGIPNVRPEIYAYGLRNAWRCSIDGGLKQGHGTGRIFCGDVGQGRIEEINIIEKGGNYGWRAFEGNSCYDERLCENLKSSSKFPILSYNHSIGQSIVGGHVYRGCGNPNLYGKYFFADTMNGKLFAAEEENGTWSKKLVVMGNSSMCNNGLEGHYHRHILSFAESESGELFILSTFQPNPRMKYGNIYRLVDPTLRGNPTGCKYDVMAPKKMDQIKRRKIFQIIQEKIAKEKIISWKCFDINKRICRKYFQSNGKKEPLIDCASAKSYVEKFCRKTCMVC